MKPEIYDRLAQVVLLFWDNETDYLDESTQLKIGNFFKKHHRVYSYDDFCSTLDQYDEGQEFLFLIHWQHKKKGAGYDTFINSKIQKDFSKLNFYLISRASKEEIVKDKGRAKSLDIYSWDNYLEKVDNTFIPQTKSQMKNGTIRSESNFKIKYAIITALYEEFEPLSEFITWNEEIKTGSIIYKKGVVKNTKIEVIGTYAIKTGMVEASILATEIINRFQPDYLLMPGVCGGEIKTGFGDIIIANKVFLLGKGKIKDKQESVDDKVQKLELFYNNENFELDKLTDRNNNIVEIIIEDYLNESESVDIHVDVFTKINPIKEEAERNINKPYATNEKISIHFEPMACSLSVIDKEDYFDLKIKSIDRKIKAVEMESYGVARSTFLANGGKTKFIICKSVMDKTKLKVDGYKAKAAYTSAQFIRYLLENNVL